MKIFKKFNFWLPVTFLIVILFDAVVTIVTKGIMLNYNFLIILFLSEGGTKPPPNPAMQDIIVIIISVLPIIILFFLGLFIDWIISRLKKQNA